MKKTFKKVLTVILALLITASFSTAAFAAYTEDSDTLYYYEYGTLKGWQSYGGKQSGRKIIVFSTDISHLSSEGAVTRLYATVEVVLRSSGEKVGTDRSESSGRLSTSYYWKSHSDRANNNEISSYGAHEVRGKAAKVIYTEIWGLN